jgi:hypothetical protein
MTCPYCGARRAADLSAEDLADIRFAIACVKDDRDRTDRTEANRMNWGTRWERALAALERLVGGGK